MIKSESNSQWSEDDSPPILVASKNNQNSSTEIDEKTRQINAANKLEPLLKPSATFKPETETNQQLPRV